MAVISILDSVVAAVVTRVIYPEVGEKFERDPHHRDHIIASKSRRRIQSVLFVRSAMSNQPPRWCTGARSVLHHYLQASEYLHDDVHRGHGE